MNLIIKARLFADRLHFGQSRKYTGEPYIVHPIEVANSFMKFITSATIEQLGENTIENMLCAAYLHDTIEDCGVNNELLVKEFNKEIADMVWQLTSFSKQDPARSKFNRAERKKMDLEYLETRPVEIKILKSIDRACNLIDVQYAPLDFQKLYLSESIKLAEVIKTGFTNVDKFLDDEILNVKINIVFEE